MRGVKVSTVEHGAMSRKSFEVRHKDVLQS